MIGPEILIERLERRQELLEESLPSLEDLKALIEAEEDLKKGRVVSLSKIEKD